jgi:hypothetical protein
MAVLFARTAPARFVAFQSTIALAAELLLTVFSYSFFSIILVASLVLFMHVMFNALQLLETAICNPFDTWLALGRVVSNTWFAIYCAAHRIGRVIVSFIHKLFKLDVHTVTCTLLTILVFLIKVLTRSMQRYVYFELLCFHYFVKRLALNIVYTSRFFSLIARLCKIKAGSIAPIIDFSRLASVCRDVRFFHVSCASAFRRLSANALFLFGIRVACLVCALIAHVFFSTVFRLLSVSTFSSVCIRVVCLMCASILWLAVACLALVVVLVLAFRRLVPRIEALFAHIPLLPVFGVFVLAASEHRGAVSTAKNHGAWHHGICLIIVLWYVLIFCESCFSVIRHTFFVSQELLVGLS